MSPVQIDIIFTGGIDCGQKAFSHSLPSGANHLLLVADIYCFLMGHSAAVWNSADALLAIIEREKAQAVAAYRATSGTLRDEEEEEEEEEAGDAGSGEGGVEEKEKLRRELEEKNAELRELKKSVQLNELEAKSAQLREFEEMHAKLKAMAARAERAEVARAGVQSALDWARTFGKENAGKIERLEAEVGRWKTQCAALECELGGLRAGGASTLERDSDSSKTPAPSRLDTGNHGSSIGRKTPLELEADISHLADLSPLSEILPPAPEELAVDADADAFRHPQPAIYAGDGGDMVIERQQMQNMPLYDDFMADGSADALDAHVSNVAVSPPPDARLQTDFEACHTGAHVRRERCAGEADQLRKRMVVSQVNREHIFFTEMMEWKTTPVATSGADPAEVHAGDGVPSKSNNTAESAQANGRTRSRPLKRKSTVHASEDVPEKVIGRETEASIGQAKEGDGPRKKRKSG